MEDFSLSGQNTQKHGTSSIGQFSIAEPVGFKNTFVNLPRNLLGLQEMSTELLHNQCPSAQFKIKKKKRKTCSIYFHGKFLEKSENGLMCHKNTDGGDLDDVNLKHAHSSKNVSKTPISKDEKQTDFCLPLCTHVCVVLSRDVQHCQQSVNPCRQQVNRLETPPNPRGELVLCTVAFF